MARTLTINEMLHAGERERAVSYPVASATGVNVKALPAFRLLQATFVVAPLVAGLDKFFHFLVNWDQYLAPQVNELLGGRGHEFMLAAGVIEVVAAIGVALWPRIFGFVVAGWLLGIIVNLLLIPGYFDVALRDFGLAMSALALALLARDQGRVRTSAV